MRFANNFNLCVCLVYIISWFFTKDQLSLIIQKLPALVKLNELYNVSR